MSNRILPTLGFHHIALRCCNIEKSLTMYQSLGMTEVARWGEGEKLIVMLDIGDGGRIELFANGSDAYHENGKWQHFAMSVDNVDEAYALALQAGFEPLTPPKTVPLAATPAPMSIHIAFVKGPDNEQVEFFKEV